MEYIDIDNTCIQMKRHIENKQKSKLRETTHIRMARHTMTSLQVSLTGIVRVSFPHLVKSSVSKKHWLHT